MNRREFVNWRARACRSRRSPRPWCRRNRRRPGEVRHRRADDVSPKLKMKVGTQHGDSDEILRALRGVRRQQHLQQPAVGEDGRGVVGRGAVEAPRARRVVRHLARHGAAADELVGDLAAPRCRRSISGKSPERDRNIDDICQMIRNCARAGILQVKYNFTLLGIPRTRHRAGPRRRRATASSSTPARSRIRR